MPFTCDCPRFCHGEAKEVSRSTFYAHAPHRKAAQQSAARPQQMRAAETSVRARPPAKRARVENEDTQRAGRETPSSTPEHQQDQPDDFPPPLDPPMNPPPREAAPNAGSLHQRPVVEHPIPANFVPTVPSLQISLAFKRALEAASLDNGDLDDEELHRLRNPPTHPLVIDDQDVLLSIKLFLSTSNASNQTYTDVRNNVREDDTSRNVLSHDAVKRKLAELTGVHAIVKDMCINSCVGYTGPWADLETCPECSTPRMNLLDRPQQHFYTIPLGPQLQALWNTPEGAEDMRHRARETAKILETVDENGNISIPVLEDIYHGLDYLEAVERGDITTDDMVLMFSIDGAQLYQKKQSDCWIYIWIIYDLPPNLRYKKRHVLPGGFIPGPNNPKNTDSFLFPGFHHLAALQKEGLPIWDASLDRRFISNPYLYLGGADGPGSVHFTGLVGHQGAYPCRLYCGIKGRHKPNVPQHYPALLKPVGYTVAGCDHDDIDTTEVGRGEAGGSNVHLYQDNLKYLLDSRNPTDFKNRRRDTGISTISIFSGLPVTSRLPIPAGFPGDIMHVTSINMGEIFVPLWQGSFTCAATDSVSDWPWVIFKDEAAWQAHGSTIGACRPFMPSSYDRPPRNIAEKISSGYKAKEWQGYYYGLVPSLLCDVLPKPFWQNFCKLARAIKLLHQRSIPLEQLQEAHQFMCEFHLEFELLYCQRRIDRLHFMRPCLHALLHIAPETVRLGPVPLHSCWTIERVIGDLGGEIAQPSNPFQNLAQRGLRRCQVNALKTSFPSFHEKSSRLPQWAYDIGDGYAFLCGKDRTPRRLSNPFQAEALKRFFIESEAAFGNEPDPAWVGPSVIRWARLRLPNGQSARSVWKESRMARTDIRRASCVKVHLGVDGGTRFANVHFYFKAVINGTNKALALVSLFSVPDCSMLEQSFQTVYSVTEALPDALTVIDAKAIQSVIAVIPHNFRTLDMDLPRYFIWEQIGMDMAKLADVFPDEEPDSDGENID